MPQLDALRTLAVTAVLVDHFWQQKHLPLGLGKIDFGFLGVRLFFVLSGFLITTILIDCRHLVDSHQGAPQHYARQFYVRRFLRIFPLYYFVLFLAFITNVDSARNHAPWLMTYASNIYISTHQQWIGHLGHFWTLAIEEQYYFFCPWFVLFLPRNWLIRGTLLMIILAPIYRLFAVMHNPADYLNGSITSGTFTLGSLDDLGMGSLAAVLCREAGSLEKVRHVLSRLVMPFGVVLTVILYVLLLSGMNWRAAYVLRDTAVSLIFVWLVVSCSSGIAGPVGRFLRTRPLVYLGKRSYGIYVYHPFIPLVLAAVLGVVGLKYRAWGATNFVLGSAGTIGVAVLSWKYFERPMNSLKHHFTYEETPTAPR